MPHVSDSPRPVALVIDDDQDTVDLLEIVLTQAGFEVVSATNGPDGIALAVEHHPALATIDVLMPGMDGLEVTRQVREATSTYIVIISSRSEEHDVLAGFDAGADDYVPKPIRPRELQARLAAVARRPISSITDGSSEAWEPAAAHPSTAHLHLVHPDSPTTTPPAEGHVGHLGHEGHEGQEGLEHHEGHEGAEGLDGRDGLARRGVRFIGSWIEFNGLRINPSRDLLVVDDRLANALPEHVKLIETMLYAGSATLGWRQLALRYRGETEETSTRSPVEDRGWFDAQMEELLSMIGDDPAEPRWFRVRHGRLRLVDPTGGES